ncbi:hypothetical protein QZH41_019311 [Actinostola sp. cb2023]|nr:hypothetical protein QZH41_019311 [Actinostola sp. cb2023]
MIGFRLSESEYMPWKTSLFRHIISPSQNQSHQRFYNMAGSYHIYTEWILQQCLEHVWIFQPVFYIDIVSRFYTKDRKIEPIYDSSLNGWNGNKYKTLSHYVQNQPAIYRMCRDATIYRFVHGNDDAGNATSHVKRAINSSSPLVAHNVTETTTTTNSNIDPVSLCPLFANKKQHRKRKTKSMRTKRVSRQNATSSNFMLCQGFHCPCVRICVGQGRNKQSFSDCSTFRIICTFNCNTSANIFPPFSPKRTSKPTRKPRGRQKVQRVRKRPRRKPKPKSRRGRNGRKMGNSHA